MTRFHHTTSGDVEMEDGGKLTSGYSLLELLKYQRQICYPEENQHGNNG